MVFANPCKVASSLMAIDVIALFNFIGSMLGVIVQATGG